MTNAETLKAGRDLMLGLHRSLMDRERAAYEILHGRATAGQFLQALIEDPQLAWLRTFSTFIVEIDETFAQKDGYGEDAVETHLEKMREIVFMRGVDEAFAEKYQVGLQRNIEAAALHGRLKQLLRDDNE
ncbi:MAG: hypothetical protein IPM25_18835 [Chloracidobacterium sp.]|nr:hypothetical protein [Chloracidobacterium sp.]